MNFTAVIFDFGGVITSSPFEAFNRMELERGLPKNFVRHVNSINPDTNAWAQFERAEISADSFDAVFAAEARAAGHALDGKSVIACLSGVIRAEMVSALDLLRDKGFGLGCITNNVPLGKGSGMAISDEKAIAVADIMDRFDIVIESSKVGLRKPDPAIYQMMCDALCVQPQNCVYLDDLGINCKPASMLGMQAIKVITAEQALSDLGLALAIKFG
jgi:putative hydrolase of the HAD superfamily